MTTVNPNTLLARPSTDRMKAVNAGAHCGCCLIEGSECRCSSSLRLLLDLHHAWLLRPSIRRQHGWPALPCTWGSSGGSEGEGQSLLRPLHTGAMQVLERYPSTCMKAPTSPPLCTPCPPPLRTGHAVHELLLLLLEGQRVYRHRRCPGEREEHLACGKHTGGDGGAMHSMRGGSLLRGDGQPASSEDRQPSLKAPQPDPVALLCSAITGSPSHPWGRQQPA